MYGPMGRSGSTKFPSAPLAANRTAPVAVCVALMAAPGMADPLGSLTVPLICDVWAHIATDVKRRPKTILVIVFIPVPLPELIWGVTLSTANSGVKGDWLGRRECRHGNISKSGLSSCNRQAVFAQRALPKQDHTL
jgi:hypothetical protein